MNCGWDGNVTTYSDVTPEKMLELGLVKSCDREDCPYHKVS